MSPAAYDPMRIIADVRSYLSDASNRLYDLDNPATPELERLFQAADEAIDAALAAVDKLTEDRHVD